MAKKKSTTRKKTTAGNSRVSQATASSAKTGKAATQTTKKTTKKKSTRTASGATGSRRKTTKQAAGSRTTAKSSGKKAASGRSRGTSSAPPAPVPGGPPAAPMVPPAADHFNGQQLSDQELRKIKSGLTRQETDAFRKQLLEKRAELVGDVESLQNDARNDDASISYEHMADVGTDSYEQEFTLGLVESERKLLREIDEALERISKGTYGVCVASGEPIGKARLEAKPWAKYCITVAREREKRGLV